MVKNAKGWFYSSPGPVQLNNQKALLELNPDDFNDL